MRYTLLLLLASRLLATGCSVFVARSGQELGPLNTQDAVHAEFGPPAAVRIEDGQPVEEFFTRRKYSSTPVGGLMYGMAVAVTFGLVEFAAFPVELVRNAKRLVFGQTVRVTYHDDGSVYRIWLDRWHSQYHHKAYK
jgi:hypothetical protein